MTRASQRTTTRQEEESRIPSSAIPSDIPAVRELMRTLHSTNDHPGIIAVREWDACETRARQISATCDCDSFDRFVELLWLEGGPVWAWSEIISATELYAIWNQPRLQRYLTAKEEYPARLEDHERERFERWGSSLAYAQPYKAVDPSALPRREWLYDRAYVRGYVSVTIGPGGGGKSSLIISEALAMASGRKVFEHAPEAPLRVWYWNGEDPSEELAIRFGGARLHHKIEPADLGHRLFVNSAESKLVIAKETRDGVKVAEPLKYQMVREIKDRGLDVLIIDPFVSSHAVSENSNEAMQRVVESWRDIAREGNCAVMLVHHTRKAGAGQTSEMTADDARGARALIDGVRSARIVQGMTKDDAAKIGVEDGERWRYFRVNNGKSNMAPPAASATWRKLASVELPNWSDKMTDGESCGVVELWCPPDVVASVSDDERQRALDTLAEGEWRDDARSPDWAGNAVIEAAGADRDDPSARAAAKAKLSAWLASGLLKRVRGQDAKRRQRWFIQCADKLKRRSANDLLG